MQSEDLLFFSTKSFKCPNFHVIYGTLNLNVNASYCMVCTSVREYNPRAANMHKHALQAWCLILNQNSRKSNSRLT